MITTSAVASGQAAVASIQASIEAMISMLPTLLLLSALTGLFGGGGSSTSESTGEGVNLGRSPDSYYQTPGNLKLPSFDVGTVSVAHDMMAMIHKDEVIIPQPFAEGAREFIQNGGFNGKSGNGDVNVTLSYTAAHYGRTNKDVQAEMKENARYMVGLINKEARNFNFGKK